MASRRFGRNQKRKLRERIERQKEEIRKLSLMLHGTRRDLQEVEDLNRDIVNALEKLNSNSLALPIKKIEADYLFQTPHGYYPYNVNSAIGDGVANMTMYTKALKALTFSIEEDPTRMDHNDPIFFIKVKVGGETSACVHITEDALHKIPLEILANDFTHEITKLLGGVKNGGRL